MSNDKKLRLVPLPGAPADEAAKRPASFGGQTSPPSRLVDDPPPTEAELAEAEALRVLLEDGREPISNSLRAAHAPPPLTEPEHEALFARALGDLGAPPTRAERAEAEHLARELDAVGGAVVGEGSEHLQLARALRSASAPRPIDQVTHERILKRALGAEIKPAARRGSRIAIVSGLFVAAAALAMFVTTAGKRDASRSSEAVAQAPAATAAAGAPAREAQRSNGEDKVAAAPAARAAAGEKRANAGDEPAAPGFATPPAAEGARPAAARPSDLVVAAVYVPSRSTDDLFDPASQFPKTGGESARIDRIAMARESDLRQNRFAAWGVR